MSLFNSFLNIGVTEHSDPVIQDKIRVSNFLANFFGGQGIPMGILSYFLVPEITYIPFLFPLLGAFGVLLNAVSLTTFSRFWLLITFTLAFLWYTGSINPDDQLYFASFYISLFPFLLLPFLMFDLKEKAHLFSGIIFVVVIFYATPWFINLVSIDVSPEVLALYENGWVSLILISITLACVLAPMIYFQISVNSEREKNRILLDDSNRRNAELAAKELQLNSSLDEIKKARLEDHQRRWASEGLAKLGEIMRLVNDGQKVYDQAISFIVKSMNANQGAIFIMRSMDKSERLELVSAYAYDRKKYFEKYMEIGEGILGQVVLEKNTVCLTEIPQNYLKITSGLGHANPKALLMVPLILNEKVYGVIEMASFNNFEKYQIVFLEKAAEGLASFISNMSVSVQTQRLLAQTQEQAEQMRSQEEKMRQNLEELQSIQETMLRKENELQNRIGELEGLLKFHKLESVILQKNHF